MTKQKKCRVCGAGFFGEPLLRYENMPAAAQYLPDEKTLKKDHGIDLEVCQCLNCGLVQLSSEPVPYYREVIRAAAFSPEMKEFRLKQFTGFLKKYSLKDKKVLEVGCGRGEYLILMQRGGADTYGLEQSKDSVEQCVQAGLRVQSGFIENSTYQVEGAPFDAFFILNFLEHLPDVNSVLRGIANNLTGDGVGLVEVPNFDMMLEKNLFCEFISDHLFYFTKETLSSTLRRNGFKVLECNVIWQGYIISAVVKKGSSLPGSEQSKRLDLSAFLKAKEKVAAEIQAYLGRFKRVAIWGAGHQALAVMSLANLTGRISYVVDSATFKQGKYTPATHIPIVLPDKLVSDPVDAIIVMAASYSDEVVTIIKQKFDSRINIVVLRDFGLEVMS